jgi:hypothetical protein
MKQFFTIATLLSLSIGLFSQELTSVCKSSDAVIPVRNIQAQSNLPLIILNTNGQGIYPNAKDTVTMKIINNASGINNTTDTDYEYNGKITIGIRGSSSQMFDKKSYSIGTVYKPDSNLNVKLLGMPEENDWVLYSPYSDKSLIRNVLAYHIANLTGRWSPRTRYCELYINNEYRGVYVLEEKIKRDNNRLDIAKLNPDEISGDDLTGGYILKVDRPDDGAWISPYKGLNGWGNIYVSYVEPNYSDMPAAQRNYIKTYITNFENALNSSDFSDPQLGYRPYVDVTSFLDYYLINELSRNVDGYRLSTFFYKDKDSKDGKLTMGPYWDYDLAFGNADYYNGAVTEGWVTDGVSTNDGFQIPFWWNRLREDSFFEASLKLRWEELRANKLSDDNIINFIDSCVDLLSEAEVRNFQKYQILNTYVWPNAYIGGSYSNEIDYLKTWISDRLGWMDGEIDAITDVLEISEPTADISEASVFPNPFVSSTTLRFTVNQGGNGNLIIHNVLGAVIYTRELSVKQGENEENIDGSIFNDGHGVYIYELKIDGKPVITGKLIKNLP